MTTIVGVIVGGLALVTIALLLAFCVWRRGRKKPNVILPYPLMAEPKGLEAPSSALSEKSGGLEPDSQRHSPTQSDRPRQQSLVASELRALREEMARLNSVMTNGDPNDARIRALERELQSYADAERRDPSLPSYRV